MSMGSHTRVLMRVPPAIPPGGRIAVIAPGSRVQARLLRRGLTLIESWGYEVVTGPHVFEHNGDLAGDDAARLADLSWALESDGIDAVWAARGGWGSARLLPQLDLVRLCRRPRWLIGFSDLSSLQAALLTRGIASWHAPLVSDLANKERFVASDLRRMLEQPLAERVFQPGLRRILIPGRARGPLAGGCLSLLVGLAGTSWQPDLNGHVVFLEEVGEAPYRIDRLLWQAREAGVFEGIRGLVFGQFVACRPAPGRPSRPLAELLMSFANSLGVPALAGLPCGHGRKARALPLGYDADLDAQQGRLTLRPPEVPRR